MWKRRALEVTGELFVGDGLVSLAKPEGHMRLWQGTIPNGAWHTMVGWFIRHRRITQLVGVLELAFGIWLCGRAVGGD